MTQRGGETSSLHRKMTERHNGEEKPPIASKNAEQHDEEVETSSSCCSLEAAAAVVAIVCVVAAIGNCRCSCRCRRHWQQLQVAAVVDVVVAVGSCRCSRCCRCLHFLTQQGGSLLPGARCGVAQKTQHDEEVNPSSSRCSLLFSRCSLLVAALAAAAAAVVAIVGVSSCRCNCCCHCCHFRCRRIGCEGGWMWWTWIGTWVWCLRCFILIRWCWVLGADALSCHVEGRAVRVGPLGRSNITIYRHHVVS